MLSVCKYVKPNISFAEVLKSKKVLILVGWSLSARTRVSKVENDRSKIHVKCGEVSVHTLINSNDNGFVVNQGVSYRRSKVIKGNQRAVKQNKQVCNSMNNQFIHVNRFQPLVCYNDNYVDKNCQSVVPNTVVKGKTGDAGQEVSV